MATFRRVFQENSMLFITMVTDNRQPLLINNIDLLRQSFKNAKEFFDFDIYSICVLPDHIHMILIPENINNYPKIISAIKHYFSKNLNVNTNNKSKISKREKGVWQRRYWEHTIRSEEDLQKHIDYIHFNPIKHNLVNEIKNWEYSSFHNFVKNGFYYENWGRQDVSDELISFDCE